LSFVDRCLEVAGGQVGGALQLEVLGLGFVQGAGIRLLQRKTEKGLDVDEKSFATLR
jgi:hypothetical protein